MLKPLRPARVALVLALAALTTVPMMAGEVIEQVLVKVNGEIITKSDFEQRQVSVLRQRPEFAQGNPTTDVLKKAIEEITPDLILNAVDELLMIQRGKELGYALGDQQFASIVENIKKENKIESEDDFQAALKQENMTMADLRRSMERQMLVSRVQQQEVADKIGVTDDEAKAYYAEHKQDFTTTAEITLREILVEVPTTNAGVNVAQDEEAKAKAENVRSRLVAGEPFARLAAELSDAPSKANGGLIGPFKRTDLAPALQKVVDPLKVGDVAPVIRTARGYQILKLETRTAESVRTFDEARADIADRVAQQKHRVELLKYLDRLREQSIIQWRNDELKKAYEVALEKRKAAAAPKVG
jgi:peptidyl-prolyl cis-trans isomerase SurA